MRLTLNVLRCPDAAVPESRSSSGADISIGRGLECDWVLQDPDRVLSKRHCVLEFRGGYWQVRDTSTNGTFLNNAAEPIGRDMVQPLSDGDRVRLGNYEIEARIAAEAAAAPWPGAAAPAPSWGEPAIGTSAGRGRPGADPFADPLGPPSGLGGAPLPGAAGGLPDDWDPMAEVEAPMPDHAPATSDAFLAPRATPLPPGGAGGIPADWDPFGDAPPAPPPAAPPAARGDAAGLPADWDPLADLAGPTAPMPAPAAPAGPAARQAPAASPPLMPAAPRQPAPTPSPAAYQAAPAPSPAAYQAAPGPSPAAYQASPALPPDPSPGLPAPAPGFPPEPEPPEAAAPVPASALPDAEDPFAEAGIPSRSIPDPGMAPRAPAAEAPPRPAAADLAPAPPWSVPGAGSAPPWGVPAAGPVSPSEGRGNAEPTPPWAEAAPSRPAGGAAFPGAPAAHPAPASPSPFPATAAHAPAAHPAASAAIPPGADAAAALAALLRGAGIAPAALHAAAQDPIAVCEQAGAALHAAIAGIRALLIARADVKREFRIEQTMLRAAGNNPVKFAATDEAAIAALLAGGPRGTRAVADTVGDLTAHEVATLAATQAAARALLLKLAPEVVEAAEPGGGGGLFGASREKRLWDAYRRLHTRVLEQFEDDFDSAFGKEFARAYEQAVAAGGGDADGRGRR